MAARKVIRALRMSAAAALCCAGLLLAGCGDDEDGGATKPAVLSEIASPVTIAGTGVGHEGNIILRVHAAFDPEPLVRVPTTAGAMEKAPFSEALRFEPPAGEAGVIVAQAGQPLPGADAFVAYPVRFAARP